MIDNAQIGNQQELIEFIKTTGKNKRIGNIAFGFDFLVLKGSNEYLPISKEENKIDYIYQWNKTVKECNQEYYDQILIK